MKTFFPSLLAAATALGLLSEPARAQGEDLEAMAAQGWGVDPEATMRLLIDPAAAHPDAITSAFDLPDSANDTASIRSGEGSVSAGTGRARGTANRALALQRAGARRALSRGPGIAVGARALAAGARELSIEHVANIAELAVSLRESLVRGRGDIELALPDHLPELPEHVLERIGGPERLNPPPVLPPEAGPAGAAGP